MSDLDRTTIILSIRPVYVDGILAGTKKCEFRTRALPERVERVIIGQTGPTRCLPGMFKTFDQITDDAASFLKRTPDGREDVPDWYGIDAPHLMAYADGRDLTRIDIDEVMTFSEPLGIERLGLKRLPQSWQYAPAGWWSKLGLADAPAVWDASCAPGGMVCSACGTPVESEPCQEHQPRAWEAID